MLQFRLSWRHLEAYAGIIHTQNDIIGFMMFYVALCLGKKTVQ